jgi:hypothetical protein
MLNSNFIGNTDLPGAPSELTIYINQSYEALYDQFILAYEDYSLVNVEFDLASQVDSFALPESLYKLRGVDRQISGNTSWVTLKRFNFKDRNVFMNPWGTILTTAYNDVMYDMQGDNLKFIPQQNVAGHYRIWYSETLTPLVDGYDLIRSDFNKFADYIIIDSAMKCLAKEESDVSVLAMQLEAIKARISKMVVNRDDGQVVHMGGWQESEYNVGWGRRGGY